MGYDYQIQYRSGTHNQAVDALLRCFDKELFTLMNLSVPCPLFFEELKAQMEHHSKYQKLRQDISTAPDKYPNFIIVHDLILRKGRIWLPQGLPLIRTLLVEFLSTPTDGHMGVAKTLARISENFCWTGLRDDVVKFVAQCINCQYAKYETKRTAELLCPLPVPHRPWENLSMDFITGLPPYHDNTVILVVVDHFSKGIHLDMFPAAHTAHAVASLFMEIVGKIHCLPQSLVSDRDPLFVSKFWQELFRRSGTQLRMSSTYHPQSDGQTEVLNRVIE